MLAIAASINRNTERAIANYRTINLSNRGINTNSDDFGAVIYNSGAANIIKTTIEDNLATENSGGIINVEGKSIFPFRQITNDPALNARGGVTMVIFNRN